MARITIMLCHERSGSHLLGEIMSSFRGVRIYGEVCNGDSYKPATQILSFHRYRHDWMVKHTKLALKPNAENQSEFLRSYFEHLTNAANGKNIVIDVKYGHIHHFEGMWCPIFRRPLLFSYAEANDIQFLHLYRTHVVEAAISDRIAHERQIWHSWEKGAAEVVDKRFVIDAAQVVEEAKLLQMQNDWIEQRWLGKARTHAITYEEMTARLDQGSDFADIAAFVGGTLHGKLPKLRHQKVTNIEAVVENLDDVKAACAAAGLSLDGTPPAEPGIAAPATDEPQTNNTEHPVQVTVAICTYNRYALLAESIASVLAQQGDVSWELIVVDNSPDRAAAEAFGTAYRNDPRIRYLHEAQAGLSNARNVALRHARGSIVSFLDDDAVASPHWVAKTWEAFEQLGEKVAVVGGKIEPIWGVPKPDWLPESQLGYVTVVDWGGELRIADEKEWVAGANISFRREPLRRAGGFDTSLGRIGAGISLLSNEDIAVTEKLKDEGYLIGYAPEASVRHLVPESRLSREFFRRRAVWQAVSDMIGAEALSAEEYSARRAAALDYLSRMPVKDRNVRGLWRETETPEEFRQQLSALYSFAVAMMAGFPG